MSHIGDRQLAVLASCDAANEKARRDKAALSPGDLSRQDRWQDERFYRRDKAARIIRDHYRLKRPVTEVEIDAEIADLRRRGPGDWFDDQRHLAARLELIGVELY